jgi:hypothetical protein
VSRPTTLPGPWAKLAQAAGGVGELARLLGVSRRTIERWGAGVLPGVIVQEHVVTFAKRRGVAITWGGSARGTKPRRVG